MVTWGASVGETPRLFISLLARPQIFLPAYSIWMRLGAVSCEKSRKARVNLRNQKARNHKHHKTIAQNKISQAPGPHCTRKSPLPLLPSGPGGVGGSTSRKTDA